MTASLLYICPFCRYLSRSLELIGIDAPVLKERQVIGGGSRYGKCPKCKASDREKLVYIYLKYEDKLFNERKDKKILHIAPETNLSDEIRKAGFAEYICGDKFAGEYVYSSKVFNLDILKLPFANEHFDLIICNHVLEHIPEDLDAMKELFRVLKTGGKAILQVPVSLNSKQTYEDDTITDPKDRLAQFGQPDHVRIYGQDYPERLQRAGFWVRSVNISHKYIRAGVNIHENIYLGSK